MRRESAFIRVYDDPGESTPVPFIVFPKGWCVESGFRPSDDGDTLTVTIDTSTHTASGFQVHADMTFVNQGVVDMIATGSGTWANDLLLTSGFYVQHLARPGEFYPWTDHCMIESGDSVSYRLFVNDTTSDYYVSLKIFVSEVDLQTGPCCDTSGD